MSPGNKQYYGKIYIHNNVRKFCGDQFCEIITIKYNPLKYLSIRILKTVIFYVDSALFSQAIIE